MRFANAHLLSSWVVFVWMVAKFPKQNLGQIFTALAPGQDYEC
jgi:hypothetical protein